MPFLLKNHSVLSWNTLLLLAAFLLAAGCGPASPGSGQSQPPAAAATQPAAETVTQASGPVPETLWDKRAEYEKEGQVVLFTDCGLYKGDTDELTGAKCEFKDGQWVLLEPKPEPGDNLIKNGDFSNWNEEKTIPVGFSLSKVASVIAYVSPETKDFLSPPYSLIYVSEKCDKEHNQLVIGFQNPQIIDKIRGKIITFKGYFKVLSDNQDFRLAAQFYDWDGVKWQYHLPAYTATSKKWDCGTTIARIRNEAQRVALRIAYGTTGQALIDDLALYVGNLPMDIESDS